MTLAQVGGIIPALQQPSENTCWATSAAMMISWKQQASLTIRDAISSAGRTYLNMFDTDRALGGDDKPDFLQALSMIGEPQASQPPQFYIDLMKRFRPL